MVIEDSKKTGFSLKRFLSGKISRKLTFAFGILVFLLAVMLSITYTLNLRISEDQIYLREVNAPLNIMVNQVVGYDAILSDAVHSSLLHADRGNFVEVEEHKLYYNEIGIKLDELLEYNAPSLINQSRRSLTEKKRIYKILDELDSANLNTGTRNLHL